ncbi:hypothetical protein [Saltatorellus ferox]|uniref:hypothetical protein n=1 Tax=Saltatorellus ferox TaxID=2528018 RepID=UPI003AF3B692
MLVTWVLVTWVLATWVLATWVLATWVLIDWAERMAANAHRIVHEKARAVKPPKERHRAGGIERSERSARKISCR